MKPADDNATPRTSEDPAPGLPPAGRPGTGAPAPAPTRPTTWNIVTTSNYTATGYLPPWAEQDPSDTGVTLEDFRVTLSDISHRRAFEGQAMSVVYDKGPVDDVLFSGSIDCNPYDDDPTEPRDPVYNLNIIDEIWINHLDPNALAGISAKLRAQADRFDHEIIPALIAAREDWTRHHDNV